jgi:MFS family permease
MNRGKRTFILLAIAMVLGYLPWYNFSAVLPYLVTDFSLTSGQTGLILSAFQAGYVLVVLATGRLADRVGPKKVAAWATLCTAIASTLFVWLARGFGSILVMRLVTGLSAGAIYVPGMAILANWFPPGRRGRVIGAYTGALTLSYAGGYFVAAPLAARFGWQSGILWTSLPAFIAAWIVFKLVDESPGSAEQIGMPVGVLRDELERVAAKNDSLPQPAPAGGYHGPTLITAGYMGHMWELYAFWGWIGPFMVASAMASGFPRGEAAALGGQLAALIILLGVPAVSIFGLIADRWGRIKTMMLCSCLSLAAQFIIGFLYGRSLALVAIVGLWIGFWVVADSGIYKAGLTEMTDISIRSTALGIQSAAGYFMTILSPALFGMILEKANPGLTDPTLASRWGFSFALLGLGAILAPIALLRLRKTDQSSLMAAGRK